MVKSTTLFSRLVSIDTLIAFHGVISSADDFQLRLRSLIERLHGALLDEDEDPQRCEALCRALCGYFDHRLAREERNTALSWQRYSLVHFFYGYGEEALPLPDQLEQLLAAGSPPVFNCAWTLLTLLIQVDGPTERLTALQTRYGRRRPLAAAAVSAWPTLPPAPAGSPRLMVFILGPCAGKWFRHADLSSTGGGEIVLAVIESLPALLGRLDYMAEHHPHTALLAWFPLLADAFDSSEVAVERIAAWQRSFSGTRWPRRLPCMAGVYSRLSQQCRAHDPDGAVWLTSLAVGSGVAPCLSQLTKVNDSEETLHTVQRRALADTLTAWLLESGIAEALQKTFETLPLDFSGAAVADYGQGFTRHGAWSRWLAEKYAILPGLSAALALPPLPDFPPPPLSPAAEIAAPNAGIPAAIAITASEAAPPPSRRWPWVAALLLLACCAGGLYYFEQSAAVAPPPAPALSLSGAMPLFKRGSSALMPGSEALLEALLPEIRRQPQRHYLIVGHSDNTGTAAVNMALSAERAEAIRAWLIARSGLEPQQFIAEGAGNTRPAASNETPQGRAQNRRVDIIPLPLPSNKD